MYVTFAALTETIGGRLLIAIIIGAICGAVVELAVRIFSLNDEPGLIDFAGKATFALVTFLFFYLEISGVVLTNTAVVEACPVIPANGSVFGGYLAETTQLSHPIVIHNGPAEPAIVKIRETASNKLAISFLVTAGETVTYSNLPDGTYKVQVAIGTLDSNCQSFAAVNSVQEFPPVTLTTETAADGQMTMRGREYTLYGAAVAEAGPHAINVANFVAP